MRTKMFQGRQGSMCRAGFSLLELMIVVVLIAGVLAIAWPSISRPMRKAELSEATQKLREAIEDGRYQAMMSGEPVFLQITQGDGELRSGGIQALISGELDEDSESVEPSFNAPIKTTTAPKGLSQLSGNSNDESHAVGHSVTPRVWKLPENIVVTSVQWMDEDSEEGGYGQSEFGNDTNTATSGDYASTNSDDGYGGSYGDETTADSEMGAHERWCLPMTAQGRGRDAEITLLDKRARQTVTVSFTAATGELEIVR